MARTELRALDSVHSPRGVSRRSAAVIGLLILGCGVATWPFDVSEARTRPKPWERGRELLTLAFEHGFEDPSVRSRLLDFRVGIGARPLESMDRAIYAELLIGFAQTAPELEAASFHARRAAQLAPATVPVLRRSASILARTGHLDEASDLVHDMFGFDAGAAADLLYTFAPWGTSSVAMDSVPETPTARLAWSRKLRSEGRTDAGRDVLREAMSRFPGDPDLVREAVVLATRERMYDDVLRWIGNGKPESLHDPWLLVHRALARAVKGDAVAARLDLDRARSLDNDSAHVLLRAGDAWEALDEPDQARAAWSRGLWRAERSAEKLRVALAARLARLEEGQGRIEAALRSWRRVLDLDPAHAEARRRIEAITGLPATPPP